MTNDEQDHQQQHPHSASQHLLSSAPSPPSPPSAPEAQMSSTTTATPPQRPLLILYATETGTAQDVAEQLAREAKRRWFDVRVLGMDEYDRSQLINEPLVVFICSTTGQGEEPAPMTKFWKFLLRKTHPADILSHMHAAVFGLGDSSYAKFNFPAKKLYKRLAQLGAQMLLPRGDGDDQHYMGYEGGLDPWLEGFWEKVLAKWPIPKGKEIVSAETIPEPSFEIRFLEDEPTATNAVDAGDATASPSTSTNGHTEVREPHHRRPTRLTAHLTTNTRLTAPTHPQDVRHLEFALPPSTTYNPADVMLIHPQNLPTEVALVLDHFNWTSIADKVFTLHPTADHISLPAHLPTPLTLRNLLTCHLDILGRPRKFFFHLLAFFTTDPLHAAKLREFTTPEGASELFSYVTKPRRTMWEILQDFTSATVPLKYLLDLIPPLRPRSFSIASSPAVHPHTIHLCVAIVGYRTKLQKQRTGVCTAYLAHLTPPSPVRFEIKRGSLRLPRDPTTPVIFVGPGTGVAPLRSLIQHRAHANRAHLDTLVFGNRNRHADFLYQPEWEHLERAGMKLLTAWSRDQDTKIYVQDRMREHEAGVGETMRKGGWVLVSGSANRMPKDVTAALVDIVASQYSMTPADAEEEVRKWVSEGRVQMECWS